MMVGMTSRTTSPTPVRSPQHPSMQGRRLRLVVDNPHHDGRGSAQSLDGAAVAESRATVSPTASHRHEPAGRPLNAAMRSHRVAIARWAIARGRTLNLEVLSTILLARQYQATLDDRPFTEWTRPQLQMFVTTSLPTWLGTRHPGMPEGWTDTLATYLDALADSKALTASSSRRVVLQATLSQLR